MENTHTSMRVKRKHTDQIDFGHLLIPREMDDMVIDAALHSVENQAVLRALLDGKSWSEAFGNGGGPRPVRWDGSPIGIEVHAPDGTRVIKPAQILERAEKYRQKPPF